MSKKLRLVAIAMLLSLGSLFAQEKTVKGTVSGADNSPLQGVTVYNESTKKSTFTNEKGYYAISAQAGQVLTFTFVGFSSQSIPVKNEVLNVQLLSTDKQLGEVIVTAHGINRNKKSLGYSTPVVAGDEVAQTQRESFVNGLMGRVPGLTVNSTTGNPGASSQVILRGIVSLDQDNTPLIVIDGLPIDNSIMNGGTLAGNRNNRDQDFSNRFIDINPADIEKYTILKGPEATALYGNMGASGAIVITTKKAKAGQGAVTYNNSFRFEKQLNFPEVQQVYSQGTSNGVYNGNTRLYFGPKYADGMQIYDNIHQFFQTSFSQKHNLAIEGGNSGLSYRWSNEFSDNTGTIPNTSYTRFSSRLSATATINPILSVNTSLNYINTSNKKANKGDRGYLMGLLTFPSRYDVNNWQDIYGNRVLNTGTIFTETDNPFWDVYKNIGEDKVNRFLGNGTITLKPTNWLTVAGTIGADISTTNGMLVYHAQSYKGSGSSASPTGGRIETYQALNKIINGALTATAVHNFGKFNNTYIIGTNFNDYNLNTTAQLGEKMYDPNFYDINNTLTTTQRNKHSVERFRQFGVFAQSVLGYQSLLYLTLTARMDAASRLMSNNPYFFYPAASLAFNFTDLEQFKNISWLSSGKLRTSYAYTGKEPRQSYKTAPFLEPANSTGGGFAYNITNGGNDKLRVEYSRNIEAGLEMQFFKNRLGFDFTWYRLHAMKQIINPRLSYGTGYVVKIFNGGELVNNGIELQLTGSPISKKDFTWDVTVNFTKNKGVIKKVAEELPEYYSSDTWLQDGVRASVFPGRSTGAMGGWILERNNNGDVLINPANGLPILKTGGDFYYIGDRTPDFQIGLVNKISYKNWSLSMLVDLRKGGDVYNATQYTLYTTGLSTKTLDRETPRIVKGVLKDGLENSKNPTQNTIVVTPYNNSAFYTSTTNGIAPEMFVEKDINAFRVRDITLSYYFTKKSLERVKWLKDLSLFVTATDVLLITNYSGIDPESNGTTPATGGLGGFGIDIGNMGRPIGINFGMRVKL
ncbi:SusC/RagA family TonB-linked outer membrane protein [Pseudoflavitalea sp. G-6-1-2]|uniref:SusC/RagA family TonB-linked outer membrane protein n=1 Tax=Pseudoflavitalea sp. G-6-1-2 TaxID=2728841 RepID=UPI00146ED54C|nr:SusC/RagA family TonB-linked outer membrane protein [Pseudoflavitalea sp. G-6-1-2]NML23792.1 SusC/RagA family TonB-linked outer membrane protein [Pseudoflavitalea sp. G-6-1-2]